MVQSPKRDTKIESQPLISVYTTVYNNAPYVEKSIKSIVYNLKDLSYEIVVVDNYSTDGTYEKLLELSKRYPIRVYRFRSTRGLGRYIAARLSRGKYLVYVDLDCIYTEMLRKIIEIHLRSSHRDSKCLSVLICPRHIIVREGYKNLNRSEDVELSARLSKKGLLYILPRLKPLMRLGKPLRYNLNLKTKKIIAKLIPTANSELRYVRHLGEYFRRELYNKLSYIQGSGVTPQKLVREEYYVWRYWRELGLLGIIVRFIAFLLVYFLAKALRLPQYEHDPDLTNHIYHDLIVLKDIALPNELGISCKDIDLLDIRKQISYLSYALRYKPIGLFKRLWMLYKLCGEIR